MNSPMTMGEKVARDGPCALFVAIADLATAHGRIPIGEWDSGAFQTDARYRVRVNGGPHAGWCDIPRFYALIEFDGWPAALVSPGGGHVVTDEDAMIAAVAREVAHVTASALPGGDVNGCPDPAA